MSLKREEHPCWLVVCDHCGDGDNTEYGGSGEPARVSCDERIAAALASFKVDPS